MMQNLHNNYLYSNNTGILFTMQRGWNSGDGSANTNGQIGQSRTLTHLGNVHKDLIHNNGSTSGVSGVMTGIAAAATISGLNGEKTGQQQDGGLKPLGGEPVNISNLLMGAKQQTTEPINVGSITIVDDDGKFMIDRKLLLEAHNSASQQTKGRRLFS